MLLFFPCFKCYIVTFFLNLNDFNNLVAVMELSSQQPTAQQPALYSSVTGLMQYNKWGRRLTLLSLARLMGAGFVVRQVKGYRREGKGRAQVNTYHLTKAGRDLINSYYESEFCKLKR